MAYTIKINDTNVTALFTPEGMGVEYQEISGGGEGYMLNGSYTADVLATKRVITLTCMPLKAEQWKTLKNALTAAGQYCQLYYYDPIDEYITIDAKYTISSGGVYRGQAVGGKYYTGFVITFNER